MARNFYIDITQDPDACAKTCADFAAGRLPFSTPEEEAAHGGMVPGKFDSEARRQLGVFCAARAACLPDAMAARAAGIILGPPPPDESPWDVVKNFVGWVTAQANKVDFAFVNVQLGIVSGQNVGDAISQDWKNAWESKKIAELIEQGKYKDAWPMVRDKFKSSAQAAGVELPTAPTCAANRLSVPRGGGLYTAPPASMSTGAKVAVGAATVGVGALLASSLYAWATHKALSTVWEGAWRAVKREFKGGRR